MGRGLSTLSAFERRELARLLMRGYVETHEQKQDSPAYPAYITATDDELATAEQLELLINAE